MDKIISERLLTDVVKTDSSVCENRVEQGRNFKGPTACSLLSDRMSDKNILSMLLLIEFVHNPIAIQYKCNVKMIFHVL